jgi:hypothetical protein
MRKISHSDRLAKQAKSQQVQSNANISMTSTVLTWKRQVETSGILAAGDWSVTRIHPVVDKWHFIDKLFNAMWPSHGLPRGTMGLVNGFIGKILWISWDLIP